MPCHLLFPVISLEFIDILMRSPFVLEAKYTSLGFSWPAVLRYVFFRRIFLIRSRSPSAA